MSGLLVLDEALDEIEPEPDGIDVPGRKSEAHGETNCPRPRARQSLAATHPTYEQKRSPETGGSGLLRFLMGGTCDGEGNPSQHPK